MCRHLYLSEITILVVHIAHGALATLHRDTEPGIDLCQLHHGSAHRQDTAWYNRAASFYMGSVAEHLGESLSHAADNLAVLAPAVFSKFAPTVFGVVHDLFHHLEHALTCGRQFVETVGMHHHHERFVEPATVADIA